MKKIVQINGKSKVRRGKAVEVMYLKEYGILDADSKIAMIGTDPYRSDACGR